MFIHWVWVMYLVIVITPVAIGGGRRSEEDSGRVMKQEYVVCEYVPIN